MKAENLVFDQSCKRKVVEKIGKVLPNVCISVFSQTLVIEAVNLRDLPRLMVSAENCDALRIANFQSNEKCDGFDRVISTVNIVA